MPKYRLLFDTNVLLDVLLNRQLYYADSAFVWKAAETKKVTGLIAVHTVTTLFYIMEKQVGWQKATSYVQMVLNVFDVAVTDQKVLQAAVNLGWKDFEDAVVSKTADLNSVGYIVTRNEKDFKSATVTVVNPSAMSTIIAKI